MSATDRATRQNFQPRIVAWEVTRSCNLKCRHCRAAATSSRFDNELSTAEGKKLIDSLSSAGSPTLILTGGEPLLRSDIYELAAYAVEKGLRVVLATCGANLNAESVRKIIGAGIKRISISIDGATAAAHDDFRGVPGAFEAAVCGAKAARAGGLDFQVNTTITRRNLSEIGELLRLSIALGASLFNPFLLVPTGRGKDILEQELSPEQYEQTLLWLARESASNMIPIRVTCAPHYQRILRQSGAATKSHEPHPSGCLGGKSFAFISHRGKVQICGFLDLEAGDLRKSDFDFAAIWRDSQLFREVRNLDAYRGRCGYCDFRKVCGGCRARAFSLTGDYLADEPYCNYRPLKEKSDPEIAGDDKELLAAIQTDFPVVERPFEVLAKQTNRSEDDILTRLRKLSSEKTIRRISAMFDSRRLGYVSTLVAARVPAERIAEVAQAVSALPGVTHNYARRHEFNLWFTLLAESPKKLDQIVSGLPETTGVTDFILLPAVSVHKIRAVFGAGKREAAAESPAPPPSEESQSHLTENQKCLVRLLGGSLPLTTEPFAELSAQLDMSAEEVVRQINEWLAKGVIRRFGAILSHSRMGFAANGMAVFQVPEARLDPAIRAVVASEKVTHCYQRRTLPQWPYNLYAMVHGATEEDVRRFVENIARDHAIEKFEILFSTKEYKKQSMSYFPETA